MTHETCEKLHLLQRKQKLSTHAFAFKWILLVLKKHRTNPNIGKDHFALSGELQKHMRTNFGEKRQKHQLLQKSYAQAEILTAPARKHVRGQPCKSRLCGSQLVKCFDDSASVNPYRRNYIQAADTLEVICSR